MDSRYIEFFLNAKSELVQFECVQISHPNFSKVYRFVRNHTKGLTTTLETEATAVWEYCPMKILENEDRDNLDYGITIQLGDVGELLPQELDLIAANDGFSTKPSLVYRTYRSDDLESPMFGPIELVVEDIAFNKSGATIEAKAPSMNLSRTGNLYTISRFPMMEAFL
jgi:hypothetical protein